MKNHFRAFDEACLAADSIENEFLATGVPMPDCEIEFRRFAIFVCRLSFTLNNNNNSISTNQISTQNEMLSRYTASSQGTFEQFEENINRIKMMTEERIRLRENGTIISTFPYKKHPELCINLGQAFQMIGTEMEYLNFEKSVCLEFVITGYEAIYESLQFLKSSSNSIRILDQAKVVVERHTERVSGLLEVKGQLFQFNYTLGKKTLCI